jgi:hypothetical protein
MADAYDAEVLGEEHTDVSLLPRPEDCDNMTATTACVILRRLKDVNSPQNWRHEHVAWHNAGANLAPALWGLADGAGAKAAAHWLIALCGAACRAPQSTGPKGSVSILNL